jgi:hypothetical protein
LEKSKAVENTPGSGRAGAIDYSLSGSGSHGNVTFPENR